jgi:hypothetical protein
MGSNERQQALARLLADQQLRENFFKDPRGVGHELGFGPEEVRRLAELTPEHLGAFARTARSRWLNQTAKLMPLTSRVLGERFATEFANFTRTHLPGGALKFMEDALTFNRHLGAALKGERRWVLDLLRYERARIRAADPRRRVVVTVFRHDISRLVRSLARKEDADVFRRPCLALWTRFRRGQSVRYAVVMLPRMKKKG